MNFITLPSKQKIPVVGLGTWRLSGAECTNVVKQALDLGYSHLDTAEMYGNEAEIGPAIKSAKRSELFITSKVWPDHFSFDGVINACNESLKKLGTDYLDLYLLHWPRQDNQYQSGFEAFKQLIDQGEIKNLGVSNFTVKLLKLAHKITDKLNMKIAVNQVELHPGLYQQELIEFCNAEQIAVTGYSPLGKQQTLENPLVKELAKKYSKSPAQICIRWLIQKNIIAIPKSSSPARLKENLAVFDFELNASDVQKIDALGKRDRIVNPGFAQFDD